MPAQAHLFGCESNKKFGFAAAAANLCSGAAPFTLVRGPGAPLEVPAAEGMRPIFVSARQYHYVAQGEGLSVPDLKKAIFKNKKHLGGWHDALQGLQHQLLSVSPCQQPM